MKKQYVLPEFDVVLFDRDIITTSTETFGEDKQTNDNNGQFTI